MSLFVDKIFFYDAMISTISTYDIPDILYTRYFIDTSFVIYRQIFVRWFFIKRKDPYASVDVRIFIYNRVIISQLGPD